MTKVTDGNYFNHISLGQRLRILWLPGFDELAALVHDSGGVLLETSCSCALGFSYIRARAWCEVDSCTGYVIDMAYCFALA